MFSALAQLSENFIFIYLGLTLFTKDTLYFKPLFILITVIGICAARWCAVFPLSKAINWFIRYRAKRRGMDVADELPYAYQVMLFWAGLRGAVGVALAAGLTGKNGPTLQATVLVVVVLTVIIFGGTTARMLEIMGIRTGVVEEVDSDDEFDIETATNGTYYKSTGAGLGSNGARFNKAGLRINRGTDSAQGSYSSGTPSVSPRNRPTSRNNSTVGQRERDALQAQQSLLAREDTTPSEEEDVYSDSDLPPAARTRPPRRKAPPPSSSATADPSHAAAAQPAGSDVHLSASGAISQLISGTADEQAAWFTQLDEGFIKPTLLLDQNRKTGGV
jgi:sodium/hydrogen exchanger-like protein 6/7